MYSVCNSHIPLSALQSLNVFIAQTMPCLMIHLILQFLAFQRITFIFRELVPPASWQPHKQLTYLCEIDVFLNHVKTLIAIPYRD